MNLIEEDIVLQELDRLEEAFEQGGIRFEYQALRGERLDSALESFSAVLWEATDFLCGRTGRYAEARELIAESEEEMVNAIVTACLAKFTGVGVLIAPVVSRLVSKALQVGLDGACSSLPVSPPS